MIGAGSAGLIAADFAAHFGADVLVIERDRVGGDCTWTGCIPSKALLHTASVTAQIRRAGALGVRTSEAEVDFRKLIGQVRAAVGRVYAFEAPERLAERGIRVLRGRARFVDARTLEVDGGRIEGRRFVICTGARPVLPSIPGLDRVPHITYEEVFDLEQLPARLVVLGGGSVGVELAQAFQRLGSQVTLLEKENRLLPMADPEAAEILARRLQSEGIRIATAVDVEVITSQHGEIRVRSAGVTFTGDLLLVAVGRAPDLADLDLGSAGVVFDRLGVKVDEHLQTSRDHIYAAGDAAGSQQFTHYAAWQGYIAARNALFPGSERGIAETVPWAVFTDPQIAQVGLSEQEAASRGLEFEVYRLPFERVDRAQTIGALEGFIKLLATASGRLLGATIVGANASEVANELSLAMTARLALPVLARSMHVYPTFGLGIQQLASQFAMRQASRGLRGKVTRRLAGNRS